MAVDRAIQNTELAAVPAQRETEKEKTVVLEERRLEHERRKRAMRDRTEKEAQAANDRRERNGSRDSTDDENLATAIRLSLEEAHRQRTAHDIAQAIGTEHTLASPADISDKGPTNNSSKASGLFSPAGRTTSPSPLSFSLSTASLGEEGVSSGECQGPLPKWAYFYSPPLTYAQVEYVGQQMKSGGDYRRHSPVRRQRLLLNYLQKALASMRQVFNRSTTVVSQSTVGAPEAATPAVVTKPKTTVPRQSSAEGSTPGQSIIVGLSSDDDHSVQCICKFYGDDATTVQCANCETWQHISCYYPGRETEAQQDQFLHVCADCEPEKHLALDRKQAYERMRAKLGSPRGAHRSNDRRVKRLTEKPSKSRLHGTKTTNRIRPDKEHPQKAVEHPFPGAPAAVTFDSKPSGMPASAHDHFKPGNDFATCLRLSDNHIHGKRAASDLDQRPKRQKLPDDSGDSANGLISSHAAHADVSLRQSNPTSQPSEARQAAPSWTVLTEASDQDMSDASLWGSSGAMPGNEDQHSSKRPEVPSSRPSRLPADASIDGPNVSAARKTFMVKWFDEELQLLIKLRKLNKPWHEIAEAIPRHTLGAIRRKTYDVPEARRIGPVTAQPTSHRELTGRTERQLKETTLGHTQSSARSRGLADQDHDQGDDTDDSSFPSIPRRYLRNSRVLKSKASKSTAISPLPHKAADKRKKSQQPKGLTDDSSGRPYHIVKDKYGKSEALTWLLLPENYEDARFGLLGLPWVCPIRSCRYAFKKIQTLEKHWRRSHRTCLLNDNQDGTFSIKGEYEPRGPRLHCNALVISRDDLDPTEPPMVDPRGPNQINLEEDAKQHGVDVDTDRKSPPRVSPSALNKTTSKRSGFHDTCYSRSHETGVIDDKAQDPFKILLSGKAVVRTNVPANHDRAVTTSPDLTMATIVRSYREWPDNEGRLVGTCGVFFPVNYTFSGIPGFEWICPVRICGRVVKSLKALSGHFHASHNGNLLNDNGDGTFTEVGPSNGPIAIKSKQPLSRNAPPRAEPNVGPWDTASQRELLASIAKSERNKPAANPLTVDEILLQKIPAAPQQDDTVLPELSTVSISEAESVSAQGSDATDGELPDSLTTSNDIQDSWASLQRFCTSKTFPPPESGPLKDLLSQRRAREISLNPKSGLQFKIAWPKDMSLLLIQITGHESPQPCSRCKLDSGIFKECVVVTKEVANVLQGGHCACVNCSWKSLHHKRCDLQALMSEKVPVALGPALPITRASAEEVDDVLSVGDSDSEQPLLARRRLSGRGRIDSARVNSSDSEQPLRARRTRPTSDRMRSGARREDSPPSEMTRDGRTHPEAEVPHGRRPAPAVDADVEDMGPRAATAAGVVTRQTTHSTKVDDAFTFGVDVIPPRTSLRLEPDFDSLRICSLAIGKLKVKVEGEAAFVMGFQGMFQLVPGAYVELVNPTGIDAVLQIHEYRQRK